MTFAAMPGALAAALTLAFACLFAAAPCAFAFEEVDVAAHAADELAVCAPADEASAEQPPAAVSSVADLCVEEAPVAHEPALSAERDAVAAVSPEPDAPAADGVALPADVSAPASPEPDAPVEGGHPAPAEGGFPTRAEGDFSTPAEGGVVTPACPEAGSLGAESPPASPLPVAPGSVEIEIGVEPPCSGGEAANEPPCDDVLLPVLPDWPDAHEGHFEPGCDGECQIGLGEGVPDSVFGNSGCTGPDTEDFGTPSWPYEHKVDDPGLFVPIDHGIDAAIPEVPEHADDERGAVEQPPRMPALPPVSIQDGFHERADEHASAEDSLFQDAPTAGRKASSRVAVRRSHVRPSPSVKGVKSIAGKMLADDMVQSAARAAASATAAGYGPAVVSYLGRDVGSAEPAGEPSGGLPARQGAQVQLTRPDATGGNLPFERAQRAEQLIVGIAKAAKTQTATAMSACAAALSEPPAIENAVATTLPDKPMAPLVAGVGIALACLLTLAFCLKI